LPPLPAQPQVAEATLLTGLPPLDHGVRSGEESLKLPSLFEKIEGSLNAGFHFGPESPEGDQARVDLLLKGLESNPPFMALSLNGLSHALEKQGMEGSLSALAELDRLLSPLFKALHRDCLLILSSAYAAQELPEALPRGSKEFARLLGLKPTQLHPAGGVMRIEACSLERGLRLASLDFVSLLLRKDQGALQLLDPELGGPRDLQDLDSTAPELLSRSLGLLKEGECLALANRKMGADFHPREGVPKIARGGATLGESELPLIFAGGGVSPLGFDGEGVLLHLEVLAALIPALLGQGESAFQREFAKGFTLPSQTPPPDWDRLLREAQEPQQLFAALKELGATPELLNWLQWGESKSPVWTSPWPLKAEHAVAVARIKNLDGVISGGQIYIDTSLLGQLAGPWYLGAAKAEAEGLLALSRGLKYFREGLFWSAVEELKRAEPLSLEAQSWRSLFLVWAQRLNGEEQPFPNLDDPWINTLIQIARLLRPLPTEERLKWPELGIWRGSRAQLLTALRDGFAPIEGGICASPKQRLLVRMKAETQLEARGLYGIAASLRARRLREPGELPALLDLLERPEAGWRRSEALNLLLPRLMFQAQSPKFKAVSKRLARIQLLDLQRAILADQAPGYQERNRGRAGYLFTGIGAELPRLNRETLRLALGEVNDDAELIFQAVMDHGGLFSFFSPGFAERLQRLLKVLDEAMSRLEAKEIKSPDDRMAQALTLLLHALSDGLRDQLPAAQARLLKLDTLLDVPDLLQERDKALAEVEGKEDESARPAVWGPLAQILVRLIRGGLEAAQGQRAAAQGSFQGALELIHVWVEHELRREGDWEVLGAHVEALFKLQAQANDLLMALVTEDKEALKALWPGLHQAAQSLRLKIPKGEAASVGRWLVLLALLARDGLWVVDVIQRGTQADPKLLEGTSAAWTALTESWSPESRFGQSFLLLSEALQQSLPELPQLLPHFESGDEEQILAHMEQLRAALERLKEQIQAQLPEAKLRESLLQDHLDLLILDHLLTLLKAGIPQFKDPKALLALFEARAQVLIETVLRREGLNVRPLLAMELALLNGIAGATERSSAWLKKGSSWSLDTSFAEAPFVWSILQWRFSEAGSSEREFALKGALKSCPPIEAEIRLGEASLAAERGNLEEARAALQRSRVTLLREGRGAYSAQMNLDIADGNSLVQLHLHQDIAALFIGGQSGSFQFGLGQQTKQVLEQQSFFNWKLIAGGHPRDFSLITLILEAYYALKLGDEAALDQSLSRIQSLLMGVSPEWIDDPKAKPLSLPPSAPLVEPLALSWIGALADLRGHALGRWILQALAQLNEQSWPKEKSGSFKLCEGQEQDEGSSPLLKSSRCQAPRILSKGLSGQQREALGALIHLHLQSLREEIPKARWEKIWKTARKLNPKLIPSWTRALASSRRTKKIQRGLPKASEQALRIELGDRQVPIPSSYACSLGASRKGAPELLKLTATCGPNPVHLQALLEGIQQLRGDLAWERLLPALRMAWQIPSARRILPALWREARRVFLDPKWLVQRPAKAAELAAQAEAMKMPLEALWARALGLAVGNRSPEAAQKLWEEGVKLGLPSNPASLFLKRLAFGPREKFPSAMAEFFKRSAQP